MVMFPAAPGMGRGDFVRARVRERRGIILRGDLATGLAA
jgi:hypothetical protein